MTHGFSRKAIKREYEDFTGNDSLPVENNDEMIFDNQNGDFPDSINLQKRTTAKPEAFEPPEEDRVNLIGDTDRVSDASMAIRALLGEGGDFRAASEISEDHVRALLVLLDVAEELNSPRLMKTAENFLLLMVSSGGKGRAQVVGAFKGLYEPNNQPGQNTGAPSGMLRGV